VSDDEQQKEEQKEGEQSSSEEDELVSVLPLFKKRSRRIIFALPIALLLVLALLGASIYVVIFSGAQSMQAFEELPSYQINLLIKNYRQATKDFDASMESSRIAFIGDNTWELFKEASSLSDLMLAGEESQMKTLIDYRRAMLQFADRAGGALEWKRYFIAQIDTLIKNSEDRQKRIIAYSGQFPSIEPDHELDE